MKSAFKNPRSAPSQPALLFTFAVLFLSLSALPGCTSIPGSGSQAVSPRVRVCLGERLPGVHVFVQGNAVLESAQGRIALPDSALYKCEVLPGGGLRFSAEGKKPAEVRGIARCYYRTVSKRFGFKGRVYSDTLLFLGDGNGITVVNSLPMERYLENVVANEIGVKRKEQDIEAVKAQAIIARTYTILRIDLPLKRAFDVYDDTRDQVFTGMMGRSRLISRGVAETSGMVLMDGEKYAECYYHAACGGRTEAVDQVWLNHAPKPYLEGADDNGPKEEYCAIAPSFRWVEDYSRQELESILKTYLPAVLKKQKMKELSEGKVSLVDIKVAARSASGRVKTLKIFLGQPSKYNVYELQADNIRWALRRKDGNQLLRSTLFDLDVERDVRKWISRIRLNGAGNGHGIGMCQWGAIGRSRHGMSAGSILTAYFPGARIEDLY